jgi:hypothetical protein
MMPFVLLALHDVHAYCAIMVVPLSHLILVPVLNPF